MNTWKSDDRKGVWLRIPITSSSLIPIAVSHGFWFHHCGSEYLLLCNWIPGGKEASKLPPSASHYIGVAGFILNSRNELLMVREKTGPAAGIGLWKIPGGLCDVGEDMHAGRNLHFYFFPHPYLAVVREVKEETGIDTNFVSLAAIMEGHRGTGPTRENASDLYCVCVLQAHNENQPIVIQESELEKSEWIPIDYAFSHHRIVGPNNAIGHIYRTAYSIALQHRSNSPSVHYPGGFSQKVLPIGIGKRNVNVFQPTVSSKS